MYKEGEFAVVWEIQASYPLYSVADMCKQDLTGAQDGCSLKTGSTAEKPEMQVLQIFVILPLGIST